MNCRDTRLRWPLIISAALGPLLMSTGCAPREFDRAIRFYADQEGVRDAAARRTDAAWFLRFDAASLHDLDQAISEADDAQARTLAAQTLTRAEMLAVKSLADEISRLSPAARAELALRADCAPDAASLTATAQSRADAALAAELTAARERPGDGWRKRARAIRAGVEPLPDDRERALRQALLAGLSPAVAAGIEAEEREIVASIRHREEKLIPRAAVWSPDGSGDSLIARWAPRIAVAWPETRDYPADYDRIGAVTLSGTRTAIRVSVDPARPTIYTYTSTAVIHGSRCDQFNYVWWFSDRPPMTTNDAAAGHIDGGTLRVTLDGFGRPAIVEIILNCGCGHEVFVAEDIEAAARRQFGTPVEGARYCCESIRSGDRPLIVAGVFDRSDAAARPMLVLSAGTHEPARLTFDSGVASVSEVVETRPCALVDYDALDRLPLGDGVASMFGPDGLVHFAGRPEGYLLAPSGMLSAGQPRKRGTQRIRWDEYLFDDPTLLDRALRLPAAYWNRSPRTRPVQ